MAILVGMDEAGYGPNLGPLVVAATAWEVVSKEQGAGSRERRSELSDRGAAGANGDPQFDLYHSLRTVVSRSPCMDGRVAIADSKALFHAGGGLRQLERGVHAALLAVERPAGRWSTLVDELAADPHGRRNELPWHTDFDCRLPVDASADEVTPLGERLRSVAATAGVRPVALLARLVFPAEFNESVERLGSKGALLSHLTIGLLREVLGALPDPPSACARSRLNGGERALVICDKHGGRNHYADFLQHHFPEDWIEPLLETRAESRYHWGENFSRVEVAFCTGGEAYLPVALASMIAKYVRELAMRALNEFWCARLPDLRPTAGYPTDARRFKRAIETAQRALEIDDHVVWRVR